MKKKITPGCDHGFLTFSTGLWDTHGFADGFLRISAMLPEGCFQEAGIRKWPGIPASSVVSAVQDGWMGKMPAAAGSLVQPQASSLTLLLAFCCQLGNVNIFCARAHVSLQRDNWLDQWE